MSAGKLGRRKAEIEGRIERRAINGAKEQVGIEKHLGDTRGIEKRNRIENVLARSDGLRANAETAIACR